FVVETWSWTRSAPAPRATPQTVRTAATAGAGIRARSRSAVGRATAAPAAISAQPASGCIVASLLRRPGRAVPVQDQALVAGARAVVPHCPGVLRRSDAHAEQLVLALRGARALD